MRQSDASLPQDYQSDPSRTDVADTSPARWRVVAHQERSHVHIDEHTFGFTTGTCLTAALAASAAAQFQGENREASLLSEICGVRYVHVETVEGVGIAVEVGSVSSSYVIDKLKDTAHEHTGLGLDDVSTELQQMLSTAHWYSCIKNGGADPDVTHGIEFLAAVLPQSMIDNAALASCECCYTYPWGSVVNLGGVGLVTLPGLKVEPGQLAINPGPQNMIETALQPYVDAYGSLVCFVFIPEGLSCAQHTFNPRLGVKGGISVLGTTGFVRPLSVDALIESITTEIDVRLQQGSSLLMTFGAQGEKAAGKLFGIGQYQSVQMSNFVGASFDYAIKHGAQNIVIAGHPGKLVKVAAGIMNTHSREADGRREILAAYAAQYEAPRELIVSLMSAQTTEVAITALKESGFEHLWSILAQRVSQVLEERAERLHGVSVQVAAAFISQKKEVLGNSDNLNEVCLTFDQE